jgi:hypothetical protein
VKHRLDRRVLFFLGAAVICLALVPVADEFWYVAAFTAAIYALLAAAAELDSLSRDKDRS